MTSIYQSQKKEINHPLILNDSSNKRLLYSNNSGQLRGSYNCESDNVNNLNDSKMHHCLSEENNNPLNNKAPSIASLSEEDNYNAYTKKVYNTNTSNGIKIIKKNKYIYPEYDSNIEGLNNLNNNLNLKKPNINYLDYKLDLFNSELAAIKSDNLMMKEDIYKYTDINKYLESEIKIQKEHNKDLLNTNDRLIEENNDLDEKFINDTNEFNELIQEKEVKQKEYDEKQKNLEIKNLKVNTDYEELININNKTKNDYNILSKNFDELNQKNNRVKNEINLLKDIQNKNFADFEEKINNIIFEIDMLKKEQNSLNNEAIENKKKLDSIQKEKEEYYNKFHEQLLINEKLKKDLYNNKMHLDSIKKKYLEKNSKIPKIRRERPSSLIKKKELVKEIQKKIDDYKVRALRYSNMDDY